MKVIFFTKYTRKGASSRLRTFQYLDFFRERGLICEVQPLFDDAYLDEVYKAKRHNRWIAFKAFLRRLRFLANVGRYDKVVIEKELFPYFPAVFERLLRIFGIKYIVDYDDAIFHNYDVSNSSIIRFFLTRKIPSVVRNADLVVAGNKYLAEKFMEFGAKKVVLIPTVIDVEKYPVKGLASSSPFTIGWIGSPITFKYLAKLAPVFRELQKDFDYQITYIGSGETLRLGNERVIEWNEGTEVSNIQTFDVGIMPLEDNIWERGKCGYKLIQYMGCAVPVVGTPIGVNDQIIVEGFNGFKARSSDEWVKALKLLMTSTPDEIRTLGRNGRQFVEQRYSLQKFRTVWLDLLTS